MENLKNGVKFDTEKNRLDLIDAEVLMNFGKVFDYVIDNKFINYNNALHNLLEWRRGNKVCNITFFSRLSFVFYHLHYLYLNDENIEYTEDEIKGVSMINPHVIQALGNVLTYGSLKYEDDNWKKLDNLENRYYGACLRHLMTWKCGFKYDDETNLNHLVHAMCNIHFLLWNDIQKGII